MDKIHVVLDRSKWRLEGPGKCIRCGAQSDRTQGYCDDCLNWEVCQECGSDLLQIRMWCTLNGPDALTVLESCEDETAYCSECRNHVNTILRFEFLERRAEEDAQAAQDAQPK